MCGGGRYMLQYQLHAICNLKQLDNLQINTKESETNCNIGTHLYAYA